MKMFGYWRKSSIAMILFATDSREMRKLQGRLTDIFDLPEDEPIKLHSKGKTLNQMNPPPFPSIG